VAVVVTLAGRGDGFHDDLPRGRVHHGHGLSAGLRLDVVAKIAGVFVQRARRVTLATLAKRRAGARRRHERDEEFGHRDARDFDGRGRLDATPVVGNPSNRFVDIGDRGRLFDRPLSLRVPDFAAKFPLASAPKIAVRRASLFVAHHDAGVVGLDPTRFGLGLLGLHRGFLRGVAV
jgi:hypothetical protein